MQELADDKALKSSDTTLEEIAQAGHVLSNLNALNEYAKVHACKQASARLLETDSNETNLSIVYYKAEIYRLYECATLSGVGKEIEKVLEKAGELLAEESVDNIYFAYLL